MRRLFVVATFLAVTCVTAQAVSVLDPLLGRPGDCYYRFYDDAHLRNHPRQMVESFYLKYDDDYQDPHGELTLKFGFTFRNGRDYEGVGICSGNECGVEGDGGAFSLTPYRDGVRLDVDPQVGMRAEGAVDYVDLSQTDDTVFLLFPASPRACQ